MPYNSGKIGLLNQPTSSIATGYYGIKDSNLYAVAGEYPGFGSGTASGGTETDITVGATDYKVHTFSSSGTLTVTGTLENVEFLVVGGGGGTCNNFGGGSPGGAGAGGYRCSMTGESSGGGASAESKLTLTAGDYTVAVGAGGTGVSSSAGGNATNSGNNSVFSNITSLGGGGGGGGQDPLGGGSGGGGTTEALWGIFVGISHRQ